MLAKSGGGLRSGHSKTVISQISNEFDVQ